MIVRSASSPSDPRPARRSARAAAPRGADRRRRCRAGWPPPDRSGCAGSQAAHQSPQAPFDRQCRAGRHWPARPAARPRLASTALTRATGMRHGRSRARSRRCRSRGRAPTAAPRPDRGPARISSAQRTSVSVSARGTSTRRSDLQFEAEKLLSSEQVGERFAGGPPLDALAPGAEPFGVERLVAVRDQPGAAAPQQIGEQQLGIEAFDAGRARPRAPPRRASARCQPAGSCLAAFEQLELLRSARGAQRARSLRRGHRRGSPAAGTA